MQEENNNKLDLKFSNKTLSYDVQYKNRFLVSFPEEFEIEKWIMTSVELPKQISNTKYGKDLEWSPISISIRDMITPKSSAELVQNMILECDERKEYLKDNPTEGETIFELQIEVFNSNNDIVGEWNVGIKDIISVDYGSLIYDTINSHVQNEIKLVVQPKYAYFEAIEEENNPIKIEPEPIKMKELTYQEKKDPCEGLKCSECIYNEECNGEPDDYSDFEPDQNDVYLPTIEELIIETQFKIKELSEFERNSVFNYLEITDTIQNLEDELVYLLEQQELANISPVEEQLNEKDSTYSECDEMSCGCPYCYIEKLEEDLEISEEDNENLFDENVQLIERLQEQDCKIDELKMLNGFLKEQVEQLKSESKVKDSKIKELETIPEECSKMGKDFSFVDIANFLLENDKKHEKYKHIPLDQRMKKDFLLGDLKQMGTDEETLKELDKDFDKLIKETLDSTKPTKKYVYGGTKEETKIKTDLNGNIISKEENVEVIWNKEEEQRWIDHLPSSLKSIFTKYIGPEITFFDKDAFVELPKTKQQQDLEYIVNALREIFGKIK